MRLFIASPFIESASILCGRFCGENARVPEVVFRSLRRSGGAAAPPPFRDVPSARGYFSSPMSSRYHFGWWMRAHAFDTVPRVIELNVPGSATAAR